MFKSIPVLSSKPELNCWKESDPENNFKYSSAGYLVAVLWVQLINQMSLHIIVF